MLTRNLAAILFSVNSCLAGNADITGDQFVDHEDLAVLSSQWLSTQYSKTEHYLMYNDSLHVWHVAKSGNDANGGKAQQYPVALAADVLHGVGDFAKRHVRGHGRESPSVQSQFFDSVLGFAAPGRGFGHSSRHPLKPHVQVADWYR